MGFAGGRALLQVEDCPQAAVERLRGEVKDLYRDRTDHRDAEDIVCTG